MCVCTSPELPGRRTSRPLWSIARGRTQSGWRWSRAWGTSSTQPSWGLPVLAWRHTVGEVPRISLQARTFKHYLTWLFHMWWVCLYVHFFSSLILIFHAAGICDESRSLMELDGDEEQGAHSSLPGMTMSPSPSKLNSPFASAEGST